MPPSVGEWLPANHVVHFAVEGMDQLNLSVLTTDYHGTGVAGEIKSLFVQVLGIARQMKMLKLGTLALDGTKVHANTAAGWPRSEYSNRSAGPLNPRIARCPRRCRSIQPRHRGPLE